MKIPAGNYTRYLHPFSRSLSLFFSLSSLFNRALMKLISLVRFSRPFGRHRRFLASIGMVIRVLGQGEPLGTRGCVSVGDEGRTSGFDVFEFGDRENVYGGKRKERSLKTRFISGNALFSLECHFLLRSTEWDSQQLGVEMREKGLKGRKIWAFFSLRTVLLQVGLNTVSRSS